MKAYNGFSPEERQATWMIQKKLRNDGIMSWDQQPCEMCGNGGFIMPHLESYFDYNDFHPLCLPCHMSLHARFSRPMAWILYLNMLSWGWKPPIFDNTEFYFNSTTNRDFWAVRSTKSRQF